MKLVLLWLGAVLLMVVVGLWGFACFEGREIPPPDESDFVVERPVVALEDNAYTYFLQATNFLVETTNFQLVADFLAGQAEDDGELRELVEKNAECMAQAKRGMECAICQAPEVRSFEDSISYVNPWLKIGKLFSIQSRQARLEGRTADAADSGLAAARFGDLVQKDAECLINYLVGVAIANMGLEQVRDLAGDPGLSVEDLAHLAEGLNKLGPYDRGLAKALRAEYGIVIDSVDRLSHGDSRLNLIDLVALGPVEDNGWTWLIRGLPRSRYLLQPEQTKQYFIDFYRGAIRDAALPYARGNPGGDFEFVRGWTDLLRPNSIGRLLRWLMVPAVGKAIETKGKAEGMLAGAQLAVACNRFEREKGRLPAELQELVPNYLAEVPMDPFDGKAFRYSAERGIAWSVGKNLTDEGGSTRMENQDKEYVASRDRSKAEDFVFELRAAAPGAE